MKRRPLRQLVGRRRLAAVELDDPALGVEEREDQRSRQVLLAGLPHDAQRLELLPDRHARLVVALRQRQPVRAARVAEPETGDRFLVEHAASFEVLETIRRGRIDERPRGSARPPDRSEVTSVGVEVDRIRWPLTRGPARPFPADKRETGNAE